MPTGLADAGLLLSFLVPLAVVLLALPQFMKYLVRIGRVSKDVHKQTDSRVPEPVGPILVVAAVAGEFVAYAAFGSLVPIAVMGTASVAFAVGLVDDIYVLGGRVKPLLLLLAAAPLVITEAVQPTVYNPAVTFPILGPTAAHLSIYTILAVAAFPVVANAFNMMDSFNGEISWFTLLTSLSVLAGVTLRTLYTLGLSLARVASTLPLVAVAAGFLVFNRYPSKAFDGDSGALFMGAMFACLAITSGVEVAAIVAIVPAILNSFYTLSSVRGFVERRRMPSRPTSLGADGKIYASTESNAPVTLVRLILLAGPRTEKDLVRDIVMLTAVSCALSFVISVLTWVV